MFGGAIPGVTDDDVVAIVRRVRSWAQKHPKLFDGSGFDTLSDSAMRAFVEAWEHLLRGTPSDPTP